MMIGYMYLNYYQKKSIDFKIGRTYTYIGKVTVDFGGFDFFFDFNDLFSSYNLYGTGSQLYEVEIFDDCGVIKYKDSFGIERNKTNKIKIINIYTDKYLIEKIESFGCYIDKYEYDDRGNMIYHKDSNGFETWYEYDERDNLIRERDSEGFEEWREYNSENILISSESSCGIIRKFNNDGQLLYSRDVLGFEEWYEYDLNGNQIHLKYSTGYEEWLEYNSDGFLIFKKNTDGLVESYDGNGKLIYCKNSHGFEQWYEYDDSGNNISYRNNSNNNEDWKILIE